MQDVRFALRSLGRRPAFVAVASLTLALGVGANAAIFSVLDAVLLRPLPYPDADRIAMVWQHSVEVQQRTGLDRLPASPGDFTDFHREQSSFEYFASMRGERVNVTGAGEPERVNGVRVSQDFFRVLRVDAVHGRTFVPSDVTRGRVAMISHGLWVRMFGADPAILERQIVLNGEPATIVGVLPAWFRFPSAGELPEAFGFADQPQVWGLDVLPPELQAYRGGKSFVLFGRLHAGVTVAQADADLGRIAGRIAREHPSFNAGWTVRVLPLREQLAGRVRPALLVLMAAVGFVLLIACVNVANLLLLRAASRQRELSVRFALGADRRRLIRHFLIESSVLALLGGAAGMLLAWWGLRAVLVLLPAGMPALAAASVDLRVALFALGLSAATCLVFGLVPALQATRGEIAENLRDGARGIAGNRRAARLRHGLVVIEVALAVVLLVGALLLARTFLQLTAVETGFQADHVLTMEIALPHATYTAPRAAAFFDELLARIAALPGVESAGAISGLPLSGRENLQPITAEGQARPAPGQEIVADYRVVTPGYFRALGIPLVAGSMLPEVAPAGQPLPVLVSQATADLYWPGDSAVGRRLKLTGYDQPGPWVTIGGVVGNTRQTGLDGTLRPQVYVHLADDTAPQVAIVVRTAGEPMASAAAVRAAVFAIDPNQPVARIRSMRAIVDESLAGRRFHMVLLGCFALLAVSLAIVGLYAVLAYSVAERLPEMGVRLALGARPADLLRLVVSDGMKLSGAGVAVGLAASAFVTRFLQALLFGVDALDTVTFMTVPIVVLLAALVGCLVPAIRAMRVDPLVALRAD